MLETIAGRQPFPRIAPPCRRASTDVVDSVADADRPTGLSAPEQMAGETATPGTGRQRRDDRQRRGDRREGVVWFRSVGTDESPGTVVCTVTGRHSGRRRRGSDGHAVPRGYRNDRRGTGLGRHVKAVLMGVANGADWRSTRHAGDLRSHARRRQWARLGRGDRHRRQRRPARRRGRGVTLPRRRVVRAVHAVQVGRTGHCRAPGRASRRDRGPRRCVDDRRAARHRRRRSTVPLAGQQQSAVGSLVTLAAQRPRPRRSTATASRSARCRSPSCSTSSTAWRSRMKISQTAGLDLRRGRLRSIARRPAHRPARRWRC